MNPRELREALGRAYDHDPEHGVWAARSAAPFAYADGGEEYVASVVRAASDLATGSPELARAIRDWASQYHLSPARANLLRPLAGSLGAAVLEVGAGCGAITRFLGETGATVLALEGSLARARIAASRCRDLANVFVVCDRFESASGMLGPRAIAAGAAPGVTLGDFDTVTLIGVLEYARVYGSGTDPVQSMLEAARGMLAPGGSLLVAIENQLGGKYLAGAAEDHLGQPFVGVIGGYGEDTPVTFGRRELADRVTRAGFRHVRFLYPFPDYKLPAAIVTDAGFTHRGFNAADLAATAHTQRFEDPVRPAYSEALARDVFVRNGLGPDTANSLLCLAMPVIPAQAGIQPTETVLAHAYTVARDRPYAGEARFVATGDAVQVLRKPLYANAPAGTASIALTRAEREPYVLGELAYRGLQRVVARAGWTVGQVAQWAQPWVAFLREHARGDELPPEYFDCTPFNVVRDRAGRLAAFDLEWRPRDAPTVEQVVFRGLYNGLLRLDFVAMPAADVSAHIPSLTVATMHALGFGITPERAHLYIARDYAITGEISGTPREAVLPELPVLRVSAGPAALAPLGPAPRLGAIVHLYYDELWPELRGYLSRIASLERIYVSLAEGAPSGLESAIARDFPGAVVRRYPNRGRDVLPFLDFVREAARDGIDLVCKIHGKRSPHVPTGEAWRRDMLEKLLGSEAAVRAIVESFRADAALGIVGPGGHVVPSSHYWERNAERVTDLAGRMGFDVRGVDFRYVAGSMFWARVPAMAAFSRLPLGPSDFEAEPAPVDGTLAHALERCFPLAARLAGMRVDETPNPRGTTIRDFAP